MRPVPVGPRVLVAVVEDPALGEALRTQVVVALVALGAGAEWASRLEVAAGSADRQAATQASGALVAHGRPEQAMAGLRRASLLVASADADTAAVLCLRLLVGRGTPEQADAAVRALAARPDATVDLWGALLNTWHPVAMIEATAALERIRDDAARSVPDRTRAAALLLPTARSAALLEAVARDDRLDPAERVCALDDLAGAGVAGPWPHLLADLAVACAAAGDGTTCVTAAEALIEHGHPAAATSALRGLVADAEHHLTARVRAAALVLARGGRPERAEAADFLAGVCGGASAEAEPFDRVLAADALLGGPDEAANQIAEAALLGIAAGGTAGADDRFFAAAALHASPRTRAAGAGHLSRLVFEPGSVVRVWAAERIAGVPVLPPGFWSRLPRWPDR